MATFDLGRVTAYAYAVAGGYVGTEAEFEQLLGNIANDLSDIENLTVNVTTLPEGSSATASYSSGVLTLGIPKGDTGAQGPQGIQGLTGNGISGIEKTATSGNVDTYTITYTNGQTTTFTVTNGEVTQAALDAVIEPLENDVSDLKTNIDAISKVINLIDETKLIDNKYYSEVDGTILIGNHTTQLLPLIPVSAGDYYFFTNFTGSQFFSFVIFNSDMSYSRFVSSYDIRFASPVVTISGSEAYVGITLYNTEVGGKAAFVEEKYKGYFVGLQNSANVIPPHFASQNGFWSNVVVVDKKGNGDYTTINDAVDSITDDSASNPYTIYIKPGVYKEVVAIQGGRHISLVGENMKDCIIRDDTGLYANSPLQISGDFLVENLTIIATYDDNPSMPHTGNKAYAIHIDYAGAGIGTIRNCKLVSYQSSSVGIGLHQDQTLIIENCELISYTPNSSIWDPSSDWTTTPSYGALYAHSATTSNVTGQNLTIKNCTITSANKRSCAFANSPDGTSNMVINLINNNLWCADGNADTTITEWYTPVYSGRSFGNNVELLNA